MAHNRNSSGNGTLIRRKDGRWQASLQVGGIRKTVYGKTRAEAAQKLAELKRQALTSGALPNGGKVTVGELLDRWLEVRSPNWRPRTLEDWRYVVETHLRPALGHVRLDKLSPAQVQLFYTKLQERGNHRTALKAHVALNSALKLAVRWGWLLTNPLERVDAPRYSPAPKGMWTEEQLRRFLEGARSHYLYPLWVVAIATGLRLGELAGLRWEDVDGGRLFCRQTLQWANGEWHVQPPKTQAGIRTVTLPEIAVQALNFQRFQQAAWRSEQEEWPAGNLVFTTPTGQPLHRATVAHELRRMCERLGIPPMTLHALRHLHASLLLAAGIPLTAVSQRLGHRDTGVTAKVYAHAIPQQEDGAAEAVNRILNGGKQ